MIVTSPVNAQLLQKLKKGVKERLEDHAVRQAQKGVDKGVEETEKAIWKKIMSENKSGDTTYQNMPGQPNGNEAYDPEGFQAAIMKGLSGNGEKIETAEAYSFNNRVTYEMKTNVNGKPTSMDYSLLLNPEEGYIATLMENISSGDKKGGMAMRMTNIMDFNHQAMIMIMEEQKIAQILSMEEINKMNEKEEPSLEPSIEKTGRTKEILGYHCVEYQLSSEDTKGNIWVAPEIEVYNQSFLKNLGNSSIGSNPELMDLKGLMMEMEMTFTSEKGKDPTNMNMKVINFEEEQNEFVMADYTSMSLGMGMNNK
jgi:hypothetical protein